MSDPPDGLWSRLKKARILQLLVLYLGGSWVVLQVVDLFVDELGVPDWATPAAVVLLLIGLLVVLATAWVQSHPLAETRARAEEVPGRWELELAGIKEAVSRGEVPHLTWARAVLGGVLAFSLLFGFAGLYVVIQDRGRSFTPEPALAGEAAPGVAVLPFSVQGASLDHEVWSEGMVSLLSFGLDGAGGLRAIDRRTILARWHEQVPDESTADLPTALSVARDVGAAHAVLGSAVSVGSEVRLVADLYQVGSGERLGQSQVEGSPDSVQTLVDRLTLDVLRSLLGEEADILRVDLARLTTRSLPALKAYLKGEAAYRRSDFGRAVEALEEAVTADSSFALAHARLANALGWSEGGNPRSAKHRRLATEHGERLPQRERRLLWARMQAFDEGDLAAVDTIRRLTQNYPDDPQAWYLLGEAHVHLQVATEVGEEVEVFGHAVELDPSFAPYWIHYLEGFFFLHPEDSARVTQEVERFYRSANPADLLRRKFDYALRLVFGSPETRRRTEAVLDTVPFAVSRRILWAVEHPLHWPARESILRSMAGREETAARQQAALNHFRLSVGRGHWRETVDRAADPNLNPFFLACELPMLRWRGALPAEAQIEELVQEGLSRLPPPPEGPACGLIRLAFEGRWDEYERKLEEFLARTGDAEPAPGDSLTPAERTARVARGVAAWMKGDHREALAQLEPQRDNLPPWWFGEIHRALGDLREAERSFMIDFVDPLNRLALGEVREELGKDRKALEDYRYFALAWKDADPDLRPKLEAARSRIAALEQELGLETEPAAGGES